MPTSVLARRARGVALAAAAGALALGLAACGGSKDVPEPADAVPASAPVYVEAVLRPDGALKDQAEVVLKKVLRTDDPGAKLQKAFEDAGDKTSFKDDVEPWLGERAGVFVTSFSGSDASYAAVIASKDSGKAKDFLAKETKGRQKRSYKDVDYWVDSKDQTVEGLVDDYVVSGTERGFKTVVDTVKGDAVAKIGDSAEYQKALDALGGTDDALGTAFVSTQRLLDALARSNGVPSQALAGVRQAIAQSGGATSAAKLGVASNSISVESASLGVKRSATAPAAGDAAAALAALPGDAWLGAGLASIGDRLRTALQQLTQVGGMAGADPEQVLQQAQQQLGIDLDKDLLSWMGDGGVFARGTSIANIGGALVITSSDPAATKRAIRKLAGVVRRVSRGTRVSALHGVKGADTGVVVSGGGSPVQIILASAGRKFVAGVGRSAVEAALAPSTTLADSSAFKAAAGTLGDIKPTFFFDVGPVLALADALGAGQDPGFARTRADLEQFSALAGGAKLDGDTQHGKLVVTLK